jgi:hypothetical protein
MLPLPVSRVPQRDTIKFSSSSSKNKAAPRPTVALAPPRREATFHARQTDRASSPRPHAAIVARVGDFISKNASHGNVLL